VSVDSQLASLLDICKMSTYIILVARLVKGNCVLMELLRDALSLHINGEARLSIVGSISFATFTPEHTRENLVISVRLADCHNID